MKGYNIIHIVPNLALPNEAFDFDEFDEFVDVLDELELWLMYDMRWTYTVMSLKSLPRQLSLTATEPRIRGISSETIELPQEHAFILYGRRT